MSSPFWYFDLNDFLNISERRLLISCKFLPTNLSNMLTRTLAPLLVLLIFSIINGYKIYKYFSRV